jgi:RNA polymerase sigma factor FliA
MSALNARTPSAHREDLILAHYPMVRKVAYRMVSRFPSCVEADDLVTIGTLGLIEAVDKFEEDRSISFGAYARIRVQGAILDELRKQDWVPRSVRSRHHKIRAAKDALTEELGRAPSHDELAASLELTPSRLHDVIRDSTVRTLVSMEEKQGESDDRVMDTLVSSLPTPQDEATRSRVAQMVASAMADLPVRERQIVDLYYFKDLTFKEIGQVLGVTESRISQLHTRLRNRLYSRLQSVMED